jgi:hypothetical protein
LAAQSYALPAATDFGHAIATREVAANRDAPTDTETVGDTRNVVTLAVAKL